MATTAPDNLMIPAGPEEVTPAWLTSALREGGVLPGRQSIVSFDATLLSEGVGFIGIVARVLLKYNGDPDAAQSRTSYEASLKSTELRRRLAALLQKTK